MSENSIEEQIYEEIKTIFGWVPLFFKSMNHQILTGIWTAARNIYLSESMLTSKEKEIIFCVIAIHKKSYFCSAVHLARLCKKYGITITEIEQIAFNPEESDLSERIKSIIIVSKEYLAHVSCSQCAPLVKRMKNEHGFNDEEIREIGAFIGFVLMAISYASFSGVGILGLDEEAVKSVIDKSEKIKKLLQDMCP